MPRWWYFNVTLAVWHIFGTGEGDKYSIFMKSILGLAVLTLSLVLVSFRPVYTIDKSNYTLDESNYTLDEITGAMRVGNAGELSRYLDSRVDISLPDKSDTYSKIQAEMIIRDFFTTNGVRDFLIKKRVNNGGGSEFCIGVLETRNGDYKTTLFVRQKGNLQLLQELRFQAQ